MSEELFELKDGRVINSPELSEKMRMLVKMAPEKTQIDSSNYTWDESGMAEVFAELYEKNTRYCPERKSWYTYDEGKWKKDTEGLLVSNKVREFVRLLILYCSCIPDEDKRTSFLKFVNKMGDRRFRDRLVKDARDNLGISVIKFDSDPYLINCRNGTFDLRKRIFREHSWNDFLTMQTNFKFTVKDLSEIRYERWEKFLEEVTQGEKDKADYLQRALGYSILGTSKEECMFILHGKTSRNGKSTLVETITHLLGDYATAAPVTLICRSNAPKNAEAATPTLARLKGVRYVSMSESEDQVRLDEAAIKQMTGGEMLSARNLYESAFTYLPQFTLWLSCNNLPAVHDRSLFASDRIRVVEFNRHFSEEDRDENLKEEFRTDKAMQGIFAWLVAGYVKYLRRGLKMSDRMKQVIKKYEKENDLVLQFLEERCEIDAGASTKIKTLYDNYKIWCKSNGYYICSSKRMANSIENHAEWTTGRRVNHGYPELKGLKVRE